MEDHVHAPEADSTRRLTAALLITGIFMLVEIAGGLLSGSLALLADAGHMATDNAALILALWATHKARASANEVHTYGYRRYKILAAFINGLTLLALSAWIIIEAVQRLLAPAEILGGLMLAVAIGGLVVNLIAFKILHAGSKDMNVRVATAHVIGDMLGSAAAIVAAIIILFTGWMPIDPILSVVVAALILRTGWCFVQDAWHVLAEGAPPGFDQRVLEAELLQSVPGVIEIHHVHAWTLTTDKPFMLTMHAKLKEGADSDVTLKAMQKLLHDRFDIDHATIQIERSQCADEQKDIH